MQCGAVFDLCLRSIRYISCGPHVCMLYHLELRVDLRQRQVIQFLYIKRKRFFVPDTVEGYVDTGIRGYVDTWIRGYVDTEIRGYGDTWIRGYVDRRRGSRDLVMT